MIAEALEPSTANPVVFTATKDTALLFVDVWAEWIADGVIPMFGTEGRFRPADDPPPALFPIIQVERSFNGPHERQIAVNHHVLRLSRRDIARKSNRPTTTVHADYHKWLRRLRYQIQCRMPETIVESELIRWRNGRHDPVCDLATKVASMYGRAPRRKR